SMMEKGSDSSSTLATLTEGNITIGGKQTSAAELGINTDASGAHRALDALPDASKLLADQQAMAAAAGTVLSASQQISGDLASRAQTGAANAYDGFVETLEGQDLADFQALDAEGKQNYFLSHSADYRNFYRSQLQWGIGGDYSRALVAVTTALIGGASGQGASQIVGNPLAPYAAQLIGEKFDTGHGSDPNAVAQALSHALLGAVLAELNGGSASGGGGAGWSRRRDRCRRADAGVPLRRQRNDFGALSGSGRAGGGRDGWRSCTDRYQHGNQQECRREQ
ncbi:TPA: hypothetical protein ACKP8R_003490, partial [Stenotrophomonas maltophilia]